MENLALLLSCSRSEFYSVVKSDRIKCDDLDCYLQCSILYAGDYKSLVREARKFNNQHESEVYFVYITHKY